MMSQEWIVLLGLLVPVAAGAQEPDIERYHERTDARVAIVTPNGDIEIQSEHDAVIAVEYVSADSLEAWYEELTIAAVGPDGEDRPDTSPVLGDRFVLRIDDRGHAQTVSSPTFPESFDGITDLGRQFFDFFPTLPREDLRVGLAWVDTLVGPPSDDPDVDLEHVRVSRYEVIEESMIDGISTFVIEVDAELDIRVEAPVPQQPGLTSVTTLSGTEADRFVVGSDDGRMIERHRTAQLEGVVEYVGLPQPMSLPMRREYEHRITRTP